MELTRIEWYFWNRYCVMRSRGRAFSVKRSFFSVPLGRPSWACAHWFDTRLGLVSLIGPRNNCDVFNCILAAVAERLVPYLDRIKTHPSHPASITRVSGDSINQLVLFLPPKSLSAQVFSRALERDGAIGRSVGGRERAHQLLNSSSACSAYKNDLVKIQCIKAPVSAFPRRTVRKAWWDVLFRLHHAHAVEASCRLGYASWQHAAAKGLHCLHFVVCTNWAPSPGQIKFDFIAHWFWFASNQVCKTAPLWT